MLRDDTTHYFWFMVCANARRHTIVSIFPGKSAMSGSHRKENKRNNYAQNYMALLTPKQEESESISCSSLCLPAANLQIYMQGSCSIKSSKPDHKQGYFMPRSLPIFSKSRGLFLLMTNWPLVFTSGQWKFLCFLSFCDSKKLERFLKKKLSGKIFWELSLQCYYGLNVIYLFIR